MNISIKPIKIQASLVRLDIDWSFVLHYLLKQDGGYLLKQDGVSKIAKG